MIYVIGNKIKPAGDGMWNEGVPYSKENIYSKIEGALPPVNYDKHIFKPHSITHCESPRHTSNTGSTLDVIFEQSPEYFIGDCFVLKFEPNYVQMNQNDFIHLITSEELEGKISALINNGEIIHKVLITTVNYPTDSNGYHKSNYILVLDESAAKYLLELPEFHLFGTSWKSTDYQPGKFERPIHDLLFQKAVIFELLNLNNVPEGKYYFSGIPLYIEDSVESPVTPILISK
jgi:kynurenine formamidase